MQPTIFPLAHEAVRDRYFALRAGLEWSDNAHSRRWIAHSDHVIESFAREVVHPVVQGVLGYDVKPTYSFLSRYVSGAYLKRHVDRQMCVWTVTHTIHVEPIERALDWPIYINGEPIALMPGEAAVFCGVAYPHWREPMPAELKEYTNAYYHFVPVDYDGPMT